MLKKWLLSGLISGIMCYPFVLSAQEDNTSGENETELNAFGYPDKELITIIESDKATSLKREVVDMPDCNDAKLFEQLKASLRPYMNENDKTISNRRKISIIMKNIKNFVELNTAEVNPKDDMPAANRLIEIKINFRKNNEDIKVCKMSSKAIRTSFYTIMYYIEDKLVVELVNFNSENPSFVFEK